MTWKKIFILIFIAAVIGLAAMLAKSANYTGNQAASRSDLYNLSDAPANFVEKKPAVNPDNYSLSPPVADLTADPAKPAPALDAGRLANSAEKKPEVNADNYLSSQPPADPAKPAPVVNIQNIKAVYTGQDGLIPSDFKVKAGWPVRFFVRAEDDGLGCMSTIMVAELYEEPQLLEAGETIVMEFTPRRKGDYDIICAMGIPWGIIKVE